MNVSALATVSSVTVGGLLRDPICLPCGPRHLPSPDEITQQSPCGTRSFLASKCQLLLCAGHVIASRHDGEVQGILFLADSAVTGVNWKGKYLYVPMCFYLPYTQVRMWVWELWQAFHEGYVPTVWAPGSSSLKSWASVPLYCYTLKWGLMSIWTHSASTQGTSDSQGLVAACSIISFTIWLRDQKVFT